MGRFDKALEHVHRAAAALDQLGNVPGTPDVRQLVRNAVATVKAELVQVVDQLEQVDQPAAAKPAEQTVTHVTQPDMKPARREDRK